MKISIKVFGVLLCLFTQNLSAASEEQLRQAVFDGLFFGNPQKIRWALDRGVSLDWCPVMQDDPKLGNAGILRELSVANGYNFRYWIAAYGTPEIKAAFTREGISLPDGKTSTVTEKARLAKFELIHLALAYDILAITTGATDQAIPEREMVQKFLNGFGKRWSTVFGSTRIPQISVRAVASSLRDPFGFPYELFAFGRGPKVSPKTLALTKLELSEVEAFWGGFIE